MSEKEGFTREEARELKRAITVLRNDNDDIEDDTAVLSFRILRLNAASSSHQKLKRHPFPGMDVVDEDLGV